MILYKKTCLSNCNKGRSFFLILRSSDKREMGSTLHVRRLSNIFSNIFDEVSLLLLLWMSLRV